ncbi:hypothetical protein [Caulobacter sp. LjRoot300]|uniref:hypothetical protein n=1 Tax=Caulobacter sp. LjRoot300 TaxID=3342321 RepID=UPI003ECE1995
MSEDSHFQQLLKTATAQTRPHRLLFVFAAAELPDHPSQAQRADFLAGRGGALAPLMCVDKAAAELADFESLATEAKDAGPSWQVVFAAPCRDATDLRRPRRRSTARSRPWSKPFGSA